MKLSKQFVLKQFFKEAKDWRDIDQNDITAVVSQLYSQIPYMDAETASKIIEQFPEFKELCLGLVDKIKEQANTMLDADQKDTDRVYQMNEIALNAFADELKKEEISDEMRKYYADRIVELCQMNHQIKQENQNFRRGLFYGVCAVGATALAFAATVLGVNFLAGGRTNAPIEEYDYDEADNKKKT